MNYAKRTLDDVALSRRYLIAVAFVFLLVLPLGLPAFQTTLLAEALIFGIFATAFNLLYGYTGLLSFGHAMFIVISGYTVGKSVQVLAPALGFPELFGGVSVLATWLFAVAVAVILTTLFAVVIGYISVQLTEIYFAMVTLSFSMAIYVAVLQDIPGTMLESMGMGDGVFTNGSDGLTFIMGDIEVFGVQFDLVNILDPMTYYVITVVVFIVAMYAMWRIVNSPFGMVCEAIRENPERARALGINVTRHKWVTFVLSGAFSALAGAILIPLLTGIRPDYGHWTASAEPVLMTVIGGPYSFLGPVLGSFTYEYLRWFISQFELLEQYWRFSFGVLLLVVVLFLDNGVMGGLKRVRSWVADRWDPSVEEHPAD